MDFLLVWVLEDFFEEKECVFCYKSGTFLEWWFYICPKMLKDPIDLIREELIQPPQIRYRIELLHPVFIAQLNIIFRLIYNILQINIAWKLL